MQGHFDAHLNLRQIILDKKPKLIVECGAGNGDLTRLLAHMKWCYPFELYSISDKRIDGIEEVEWITSISYEALKEFKDESIDLCIIDTDHNYWTLKKELNVLKEKMAEGGLVVMHDVEMFYYDTGMAMSYWNGYPYPEKEILEASSRGGCGLALIDFLSEFRGFFKLVRYIPEHFGAAVIEKKTVKETCVIRPGPQAVFAQPKIKGEPIPC